MGHVYFIQVGSSKDIKIGYSTNIKSRLQTIQTSIPEPIKLLGYISGTMETEKEMHKRFRIFRKHGEWFRCDKSIIEFLNEVNEMKTTGNMDAYIELDENMRAIVYGKIRL